MTTTHPAPATASDRVLRWATGLLLLGSYAFAVLALFNDLRGPASIWKQGDWLINSIEGPIRRGPVGSAIIHVADTLGLGPVTVVIGIQLFLATVLYGAFALALAGIRDARVAALLVFSPAMFPMMWLASIHHGSLRKELIGMAAIALLLVYLRRPAAWLLVLAGAIMAAGVWAHEITVLFLPVFAYVGWRCTRTGPAGHRRLAYVVAAVTLVSTAAACWYTLTYVTVPDVAQVCDPLTDRGVPAKLCDGAIKWTTRDGSTTLADVARRNATTGGLVTLGVTLVLSLAAPAYLAWTMISRKVALLGVAAAVPFLPLFVVVVDWGRWISCGVFAFVALVAAHGLSDDLPLRRRPLAAVVLVLGVVGTLFVPYHVNDVVVGGIWAHLDEVLREFARNVT